MHARIYFIIVVITSAVIGTFMDRRIAALTHENEFLRKALNGRATYDPVAEVKEGKAFDHFIRPVTEGPVSFNRGIEGEDISAFKAIQEKLGLMERHLEKYKSEAVAYQMMISALHGEIRIKDSQLDSMENAIARYAAQNRRFVEELTQKGHELDEALEKLGNRTQKTELEQKVKDLTTNLRNAEADACYARAQLTEAAGNKILFARQRRKEYFREALEGYRIALSLGKKEAGRDIHRLERTLNPPPLASI